MTRFLALSAALGLLLLPGCATTETTAPLDAAKIDYGAYPENFEQIVKDHFTKTRNDPGAAQFRFGKPFSGYIQEGPLMGKKVQDAGYFVEVWLKAKDRTGNYLPERALGVLIKNGEVLMELNPSELQNVKRGP